MGGVGCGTPSTCRTPPRTVRPSTGSAGATITSPLSASISACDVPAQQRVDLLERDPAVERADPARRFFGRELARVEVDDVAVGVAERDPPRAQHGGHLHGAGEVVGDDEHHADPAR